MPLRNSLRWPQNDSTNPIPILRPISEYIYSTVNCRESRRTWNGTPLRSMAHFFLLLSSPSMLSDWLTACPTSTSNDEQQPFNFTTLTGTHKPGTGRCLCKEEMVLVDYTRCPCHPHSSHRILRLLLFPQLNLSNGPLVVRKMYSFSVCLLLSSFARLAITTPSIGLDVIYWAIIVCF